MSGGVRWYLVGCLVLASLAGCGRGFMFAEREPWRHDAEVNCLKSGAVRESAGVVRIAPIDGPGICGADFPLKVAMLGEGPAVGFADEPLRPPGSIPTASQPRWPIAQPRTYSPPPSPPPNYSAAPIYAPPEPSGPVGAPLDLNAPIYRPSDNARGSPPMSYPPAGGEARPLGPPAPQYTGSVEVKPAATLACPLVAALDHWLAQSVQPAAQRWFRQPVVEIKQISSYSCRSMNNQAGAKISEHAFGNAIDVAAFVLADGRTIRVKDGWRGAPEEQGFLRDVQGAACDRFSTVLAPGADAFHYDHIHVDLMRRTSGRRICQPAAEDGELVAARAQSRNPIAARPSPNIAPAYRAPLIDPRNDPYAWRGAAVRKDDALTTGSVAAQRQTAPSAADNDWIEDDGPRPAVK